MTKRKMPKQRRLAFESLETRTLLAIIANGDRGFVEVDWNQPVPPVAVTHEQAGGPTYDFKVRLYPKTDGTGNIYPVKVSFAPSVAGEATISPVEVTFAAGEANGNPSAWKYFSMTGKDDPPVIATRDDGNIAYSISVTTTSGPAATPDPNFTGINGSVGSFTNLDNDLWAKPDEGYSLLETDASWGETAYFLNVGANDQDLGGDGSWHVFHASLNIGQGEVTLPDTLAPLRSVRYRPADDWYGDFTIFHAIKNEWGEISGTTAEGTVVNIPDKPIANPDEGVTSEENGSADILDVVGNDTDADNWPLDQIASFGLTIASVTAVGGTPVKINGDTGIRFTPFPNLNSAMPNQTFSVTYKVKDPEGNVSDNEVTIPITVTPRNAPPRANGLGGAEGVETPEGQPVSFSTLDDAGEGDEYAGQVLTYEVVIDPVHGTVDPDGFGGWVYTPSDPNYNGDDSFQYTVTDDSAAGPVESLTSDLATVSITINPVNDPPIAYGLGATTNEDTPVSFTLTGDDGDPMPTENQALTFAIVSGPGSGQITSFNASTGEVTYLPDLNYNNSDEDYDTITFTVTDDGTAGGPALTSELATITIRVNPVNDAPVAVADVDWVINSPDLIAEVFWNDYDVDEGDTFHIHSWTQGTYVSVSWDADFEFFVVEWPGGLSWSGSDYFEYTIADAAGATSTAGVSIDVYNDTLLASGEPQPGSEIAPLDPDALAPFVAEARARWEAAGFEVGVIDAAVFRVVDLPELLLGATMGNIVLIDRDAAGFGWFIDATPGDDHEFRRRVASTELWATPGSRASGRMDLLTAIMHEMGHLLGVHHAADGSHSVMEETLAAGVRRVPGDADLAALLIDGSNEYASLKRRLARAADHFFADAAGMEEVLLGA